MGGTSSYSHGNPLRGHASTVGGSWGYNYDGLIEKKDPIISQIDLKDSKNQDENPEYDYEGSLGKNEFNLKNSPRISEYKFYRGDKETDIVWYFQPDRVFNYHFH